MSRHQAAITFDSEGSAARFQPAESHVEHAQNRPTATRPPHRARYGGGPAALVSLVDQDRLRPEIGRNEAWARTAETLVDRRERRIRGKAVLLTGGGR
ncbi:hypothetical protein VM98_33405 [Streptomyces rubellomurinus subsp. indigoferus]|nr:hypothetical protein VM98_33405 [Streptomyces rubellomurinus subsp. indigoferus]